MQTLSTGPFASKLTLLPLPLYRSRPPPSSRPLPTLPLIHKMDASNAASTSIQQSPTSPDGKGNGLLNSDG